MNYLQAQNFKHLPQICRFAEELNLRAPIQVTIHANKLRTKTRANFPFFRPIQILLATGPSGYLAVCTSPTPWQRRCPTSPLTTTPAPSRRQRLIGIFEHRQCLYKCLVFPSPLFGDCNVLRQLGLDRFMFSMSPNVTFESFENAQNFPTSVRYEDRKDFKALSHFNYAPDQSLIISVHYQRHCKSVKMPCFRSL